MTKIFVPNSDVLYGSMYMLIWFKIIVYMYKHDWYMILWCGPCLKVSTHSKYQYPAREKNEDYNG